MKKENIKIWFKLYCDYEECLTLSELKIKNTLNKVRAKEYSFSRTFLRYSLSDFLKKPPLEINISALPGKMPVLLKDNGYISFSHTKDAVLIVWSSSKVGVDLERFDRKTTSKEIVKRFFSEKDFESFNKINEEIDNKFIKIWVIKEAISKHTNNSLWDVLNNWEWDIGSKIAINRIYKNNTLKVFQYRFKDWELGIACDNLTSNWPIICIN